MGGKIPVNKSHLVIDKPESVSLVSPPTIIINATKKVSNNNQSEINLLFCKTVKINNYENLLRVY